MDKVRASGQGSDGNVIVHSSVDTLHKTCLHLCIGRSGQSGLVNPGHGACEAAEAKVVVYYRNYRHTSHKCVLALEVHCPVGIAVQFDMRGNHKDEPHHAEGVAGAD